MRQDDDPACSAEQQRPRIERDQQPEADRHRRDRDGQMKHRVGDSPEPYRRLPRGKRSPRAEYERDPTRNERRLQADRQAGQVLAGQRIVEVAEPEIGRQCLGPRSGQARDHDGGERRDEHHQHDDGESDENGRPTSPAPQQHRRPPFRDRSSTVRTPCGTARKASATMRSAPWRSPPPRVDRT